MMVFHDGVAIQLGQRMFTPEWLRWRKRETKSPQTCHFTSSLPLLTGIISKLTTLIIFSPAEEGGGNRSEINTDANCSQIRMLLVQRSVSLVWILKTRDVRKKGRRQLALGTAMHHSTISKCYCVGFHFQHGNWRKNLEWIRVAVSSEPMLRLKVSLSVCAYI